MIWPTKKLGKIFRRISKQVAPNIGKGGGGGGEVFIAARKIIGGGKIIADGGAGSIGGKGGRVTLLSEDNQFSGTVSAKGGKSVIKPHAWFEKWWGILILGIIASAIVAIIFTFL